MFTTIVEADAMERATAKLHSTFPIDRLPREIVAEIFCNFVHGPQGAVWISASNGPLLLCRVSSSWRAFALVTPELWTSIGIRIRLQNDRDPCNRIVNMWLERSGTLPLTVAIHHINYKINRTVLDAILTAVSAHSSRWQIVKITARRPDWFPRLRLENLPLLREFHLRLRIAERFKIPISLPFDESPHLTRLSWPHSLDALSDSRVPWSQISHLSLTSDMTFFAALETIRLCPQLEDFTTRLSVEDYTRHRHPTTVRNRRLRTLKIHFGAGCNPFFDSLILPGLSECSITARSGGASDGRAFLDFLARSNCRLYKLDLYSCAFGPFIEFLEHKSFESIGKLKIELHPHFTDDELIGLVDSPSPGRRVLLPKLTHLTLCRCLDASKGMLADMVLSRRRQQDGHKAEPLQYLRVTNEELYEEDVNSIEDEVRGGFRGDIYMVSIICENGERISRASWYGGAS